MRLLAEAVGDADVWKLVAYVEAGVIASFAVAYIRQGAQNRADLREILPLTTRFLAIVEKEERQA